MASSKKMIRTIFRLRTSTINEIKHGKIATDAFNKEFCALIDNCKKGDKTLILSQGDLVQPVANYE